VAHEIFGNRFAGRRDVAWHKIGTVIPEDEVLTVTAAFIKGGLNYGFDRVPLEVLYEGKSIPTDKYAIVRQRTHDSAPEVVSVVSNSYDFLTNMEIAAKLDPLAEQWQVETVGALQGGMTVFAMLNAGDQKVCGEDCKNGFLVSDNRDGSTSMTISFVTTRVVCANTLAIALNSASLTQSITHNKTIGEEVDFWLSLMPEMEKIKQQTTETLESFGERKLTKIEARDIFQIAFPVPAMPKKLRMMATLAEHNPTIGSGLAAHRDKSKNQYLINVARMQAMQEAAAQNFIKIGKEYPKIKNTGWAALNAVTEIVDHGGSLNATAAAEAALFGTKASMKTRTFRALEELVKS
jgi:phage/plasmid-like protein (TIGR03299 family)